MRKSLSLALALTAAPLVIHAVETKTWSQAGQADYEKATVKRLSIRSDGRITLAPAFKEVFDSSAPYLWALAQDSNGNLYAGGGGAGGSKAKLYRIDTAGKNSVAAEFDALEIHAIAIDRADNVYAATSPDGKVYKMAPGGKAQLFYDPKAKYIWALAFDSAGNLFVATGDAGEIHKVTPDGKGLVFAKTEEVHARSMAIDGKDNLIVGTEPGGLIVRISPKGEGFVLHQASRREVTAVAVAKDGSIYAAAVGSKPQAAPAPPSPVIPVTPAPSTPAAVQTAPTAAPSRSTSQPPPTLGTSAVSLAGGSEVWMIGVDGFPRKMWTDSQEIVYALAFDAQQRLLMGTGNKGNVYRLDKYPLSTMLVNSTPTQVLVFATGRDGQVHLATGNIGKVYRLGPELEKDGYLESDVFDAGSFSYWGRLSYAGKADGGAVGFEARSGNLDRPQKNWSPWTPVVLTGDNGQIAAPASRFVQYKLTMKSGVEGGSPQVDSVDIAYLPKNVAPVIQEIEATPANYRFPQQSLVLTPSQSITLQPLGRKKKSGTSGSSIDVGGSQTMNAAKGWVGVRWLAVDENGDNMIYKVEIRGVGETEWKLLKDKVRDKYYSWDSSTYPDGEYQVRVTASDSPSNPPASALTATIESDPFVIDNTPPQVLDLKSAFASSELVVSWRAKDALNLIDKAEYSLDGGEWLVVEPVNKLSDAKQLDYNLTLSGLTKGEHTVAIRVTDDFDNQAVAKTVVK